jgi:CHAT domain-containing protein
MPVKCRFVAAALAFALGTTSTLAADAPASIAPPRSTGDITQLLDQFNLDPKIAAEQRAIVDSQPPQTQDKKDLANFYKARATAAERIGASQQFADDMQRVVQLGGAGSINDDLFMLAYAEETTGNPVSAVEACRQALARIPASSPGKRLVVYRLLARLFVMLGDMENAQTALNEGEVEYKAAMQHRNSALLFNTYTSLRYRLQGEMLKAKGRLPDAERMFRGAVEVSPRAAAEAAALRAQYGDVVPVDETMQTIGNLSSLELADVLAKQGRLFDAEMVARDALINSIRSNGKYSFHTGMLIEKFSLVLLGQGRYVETERMVRAGIDIYQRIGVPKDSIWLSKLRTLLGSALLAQNRSAEALVEFEAMRAALAAIPAVQARLAAGTIDWSLALLNTGKPDDALMMLNRLIPASQQWLGDRHFDTAELIGVRGMALAAKGDRAAALDSYRSVLPVLLNAAITPGDEPSPLRTQRLRLILEAAMSLLGQIRGTPLEKSAGIDAASEAFRLTDALSSQKTQSAVAASALRAAANDPAIGREIRKEQDLKQETASLHRILRDLMSAPAAQQLPKVIAGMKKRVEGIKGERATLQMDIEKRFPAYANLIRPQPPSLTEARAVLKSGEALINIFSTDTETFLWSFTKDGPVVFTNVKLGRAELAHRVKALRKALDPGDIDITTGIPDFDLDTAYRLYADLLVPVGAGWKGAANLLVVTNGALGQLPLTTLPTAKVTVKSDPKLPYAHFKNVPWLIRQAAFTQLPSVNALVALRKLPAASVQRSAFIGFGDPQFTDSPIQIASNTRRLRNLSVSRPSQAEVEQAKPVEWMDYAKIPPLPDTRDEILALAQALKADPANDVLLGSQASRANVKKLDLSKRRVVAFATHGLLAGDFPGVSEPSLALANPGGGQHGLLTLEDIMGLKLDADWVVLSACNTAGGDGQGVDALSGLGRGFFYAGSRALLVTHWPVESASARLLVTGLFERQAADAKLSRAEALRQSMLALMQQRSKDANFAYAHPLFWAPYALVGEGGI